jgi:hypothetical protein
VDAFARMVTACIFDEVLEHVWRRSRGRV